VKLAPTQFVALPLTVAVGPAITVTVLLQMLEHVPSLFVTVKVKEPTPVAVTEGFCLVSWPFGIEPLPVIDQL
jgi:hypothetical protein